MYQNNFFKNLYAAVRFKCIMGKNYRFYLPYSLCPVSVKVRTCRFLDSQKLGLSSFIVVHGL